MRLFSWIGVEAERFCLSFQLDVLKRIGGPTSEVDYLASQTGTHCNIDGDGDCDWDDPGFRDDYAERDW